MMRESGIDGNMMGGGTVAFDNHNENERLHIPGGSNIFSADKSIDDGALDSID